MEKLDFACQGLKKRACENRKAGFCMQAKETNTRNRKKGNMRVGEKECRHAKQEKRKFACRGKRRRTRKKRENEKLRVGKKEGHTRKKEKMRNCVSRKRKADTQNRK